MHLIQEENGLLDAESQWIEALISIGPNLVFVHGNPRDAKPILSASKIRGLPVFMSLGENPNFSFDGSSLTHDELEVMQSADAIFSNSDSSTESMVKFGIGRNAIVKLPLSIHPQNTKKGAFSFSRLKSNRVLTLGISGRSIDIQELEKLLYVVDEIHSEKADAKIRILIEGGDKDVRNLRRFSGKIRIHKSIFKSKLKKRQSTRGFYRKIDFYVALSSDAESSNAYGTIELFRAMAEENQYCVMICKYIRIRQKRNQWKNYPRQE